MLIATIENVLNRGIPRSPRAQRLCAELAGHAVAIEVENMARVRVESNGQSLQLSTGPAAAAAAAAQISGGLFSLLGLGSATPEAVLQRGDVRIDGDVDLAHKFRELALLLRPDLEEELALIVGDIPAHQAGRAARLLWDWTRKAASTTVRNLAEYAAHEQRDLVPRAEADQLLTGVDVLRDDLDRLVARVEMLTRRGARPPDTRGA